MKSKSNLLSRRLWNKDFILICLVCCIASYPNSILQSVLPVYILDLGGTNTITGFMSTGLTILTMVTNIIIAPLIDSVGRRKMVILGSGLFFLNMLLFCFTSNLTFIFALRVLCGFTTGVFFPVPPIIVADVSDKEHLVDAVGIFGAAASIAFAVTPTIGLWLYNSFGPTAMFASGAIMGGISFVITLFIQEHYKRPEVPVKGVIGEKKVPAFTWGLISMMLLPMLINLTVCFSNSPINTFLTPCGLSRGIRQISLFFIVNQSVCVAAKLLTGRVLEKVSKKTCTFAGIVLVAGGTMIVAFAHSLTLMMVAAVLMGLGVTAVTQIFQAENLASVPSERRGIAGTAYMLSGSIGSGIGSSVWGAVSTGMGYTITYAAAGASALAALIFYGIYWKKNNDQ